MLSILKKLQKENRVWIPHQVAKEFYENRCETIYSRGKSHTDIMERLDGTKAEVLKRFDSIEVHKKIESSFDSIREQIESKKPRDDWSNDETERELNQIFKGNVGERFQLEKLEEIYKKGTERYANGIPPGYKDMTKDVSDKTQTKKFGDLIVWYQIIEMAKSDKNNTSIILVTDDRKEDWWWKVSTRTIGPRPELRKEIKDDAGVEFYMYPSNQFMKYAKQYLEVDFGDDLIELADRISQTEESAQLQDDLSVSSEDDIVRMGMGVEEILKKLIYSRNLSEDSGISRDSSSEAKDLDDDQVGGSE